MIVDKKIRNSFELKNELPQPCSKSIYENKKSEVSQEVELIRNIQ